MKTILRTGAGARIGALLLLLGTGLLAARRTPHLSPRKAA
ncbi:hypothetical protein SAMN05216554_0977 [Herbiconiux ginsengi]|uniref:Uncharacterized protein n=1 Tax=Herbiconiux ginsengi TaxID=381665 RepID=A0A1H3LI05_9MICO|nr:hypothetical protein SAMN05216554_0977 [Herbiconiux ginsengi]